jgi:hypothetical protein
MSLALKAIWQAIIAWFIEMVWPEIQKLLISVIREVAEWFYEKLRASLKKNQKDGEAEFNRKAEESEKKAEQAETELEIEKYKAEARAWRQAFEMLHEKNEQMEAEFNKIMSEGISKAAETTASLKVDDIFEFSADKISLKPGSFPALPPPDEKK